ncbi:MAG: tetratricopeptide repeat protein [Bacteroidota bacterium]
MQKKNEKQGKRKQAIKPPAADDQKLYLFPVICVILAIVAFIPVFKAGFVNWDDGDYVTSAGAVKLLGNFRAILTTPVQGNFHPLTMLSLALNFAVSGLDATSYHVVNLLLHLLNVLLVFYFAWLLTGKQRWTAFITALLFAIHPLHVESVAWVAERKDVLYTFFFLAALIRYLKYLEKRTLAGLAAVVGLFILSLLSKPAAIIFPVVLLAIDYYYNRLSKATAYVEKIPFLLLSLVFGILTLYGQSMTGAIRYTALIPAHFKLFFGFYGTLMYLYKSIVPLNLCTFYPYPAINAALPAIYYLSALAMIVVGVLFFIAFRKNRLVIFSGLFFIVNLALVLQFYPVGSAVMADRYTYLPLIGLFLVAGHYFQRRVDRTSGRPALPAMALLILVSVGLVILTYRQAATWENSAALWDQAIRAEPSSKAYTNRGVLYQKAGQKDNALQMFTEAIKLNKAEKDALINRGDLYFADKNYSLAIADYNECLAVYPGEQQSIQNRGAAYAATGKTGLALEDMNLALKLNPASKNGYANRALLEQALNKNQAAIDDFYEHMKITPDTTGDVWNAMGVSYLRLNRKDKALECFDKAIGLTKNPAFVKNRELVLPK